VKRLNWVRTNQGLRGSIIRGARIGKEIDTAMDQFLWAMMTIISFDGGYYEANPNRSQDGVPLHQPTTLGPHRVMMRPREGHDVHVVRGRLDIEPTATIRCLRDIYSNSIAILTFAEPSRKLSVVGEVDVDLRDDDPNECLITPANRKVPRTRSTI